jgi:hypothetical protein
MLLTVKVLISQADSELLSEMSSEYLTKYLLLLRLHSIRMPKTSSTASLWLLKVLRE